MTFIRLVRQRTGLSAETTSLKAQLNITVDLLPPDSVALAHTMLDKVENLSKLV